MLSSSAADWQIEFSPPVNGQSVGGLSQLTWSKNLMNDNPEGWQIIMDNTNAERSTEKP